MPQLVMQGLLVSGDPVGVGEGCSFGEGESRKDKGLGKPTLLFKMV